jgi:hypothetical protein
MATPKTGNPIGRPRGRRHFRDDPERFAIPFTDALVAFGVSADAAFKIAAAQIVGKVVDCQKVGPRRKRRRGAVPAGVLVGYERDNRPGGPTTTINGKAATLRQKAKRMVTVEEVEWRLAMARAFMLALKGLDHQRCAEQIKGLAAYAGEAGYAQAVLLPLLRARFCVARLISRK